MTITDYYVTTDAMGSVMTVLDESGNELERRSYDVFGQVTYMLPDGTVVSDSPTGVDIGFQGQLMDELTGLYQMGYRWYSPILGRWLSRDPIGLAGGVNQMTFVLNVPITFIDPMGLLSASVKISFCSASGAPLLEDEKTFEIFTSLQEYAVCKIKNTTLVKALVELKNQTEEVFVSIFKNSVKQTTGLSTEWFDGYLKVLILLANQRMVYSKVSVSVSGTVGCGCRISFNSSEGSPGGAFDLLVNGNDYAYAYFLPKDANRLFDATLKAAAKVRQRMGEDVESQIRKCYQIER